MQLTIIHSGQTGVERGADRAARTVSIPVAGTCMLEKRDEIGVLPREIAADLSPCTRKGSRTAITDSLGRAHVLVIGVPDAGRAHAFTGVDALRRTARELRIPHWIVDPITDLDEMCAHVFKLADEGKPFRVMVSGPRETRWSDGARLGFRIVASLANAQLDAAKRESLTANRVSRFDLDRSRA